MRGQPHGVIVTVLYDIACSRFKFSIAAVDILVSNYLTSDDLISSRCNRPIIDAKSTKPASRQLTARSVVVNTHETSTAFTYTQQNTQTRMLAIIVLITSLYIFDAGHLNDPAENVTIMQNYTLIFTNKTYPRT